MTAVGWGTRIAHERSGSRLSPAFVAVDAEAVAHADVTGSGLGYFVFVGDDDEGHAVLFLDADEHFHDAGGVDTVKIAGGLVGQQDGGFVGKGTGDGYALALSSGKLVGILMEAAFKTHLAQKNSACWARLQASPPTPSMGTCTFSRALSVGRR